MHPSTDPEKIDVLGAMVDTYTFSDAVDRVLCWSLRNESRSVYFCNVHAVITARKNRELQDAINSADMVNPDGKPVAWLVGVLSDRQQEKVSGPDFMIELCERLGKNGLSCYLYGSTQNTLEKLEASLNQRYENLRIVGKYSPPFRRLTMAEEEKIIFNMNSSGANVVFVGLGCPKQEIWISNNREKIEAVTLGVGAAFDYHAGVIRRAPEWMQRNGFEWLFRLLSEPRRLWRRYLVTNIKFVFYVALLLIKRTNHSDVDKNLNS